MGNDLVTKVCLFVTFSCLRSQTLYKEKLLQYLDIVGVVHLLSISVQRFCDPAGARTQDPNIKSVVLYLLSYGFSVPKGKCSLILVVQM